MKGRSARTAIYGGKVECGRETSGSAECLNIILQHGPNDTIRYS